MGILIRFNSHLQNSFPDILASPYCNKTDRSPKAIGVGRCEEEALNGYRLLSKLFIEIHKV
jgi:hypothetical protein